MRAERLVDCRPAHVMTVGTTEAMVAELPKVEPAMPHGGDLGGMGGMM